MNHSRSLLSVPASTLLLLRFAKALEQHKELKVFSYTCHARHTAEAWDLLASALSRNDTLEAFELSTGVCFYEEALELVGAICHNTKLRRFVYKYQEGNQFARWAEIMCALIQLLQPNTTLEHFELADFVFFYIDIDASQYVRLADAMENNYSLKQANLDTVK